MKILIVGAGRIGTSVAESLVSEANDITVVDLDAEHINSLQQRFDLRGLVGNATSPQVLTDAGAADRAEFFCRNRSRRGAADAARCLQRRARRAA